MNKKNFQILISPDLPSSLGKALKELTIFHDSQVTCIADWIHHTLEEDKIVKIIDARQVDLVITSDIHLANTLATSPSKVIVVSKGKASEKTFFLNLYLIKAFLMSRATQFVI